jgi:hypothetical protein
MGRIRGWVRRLERARRDGLESFTLLDGSRYWFDASSPDLFMFWVACARTSADRWPEPPEVLQKLTEARDVEEAVEKVRGEGSYNFIPYDLDALISERRLEPRPLASRYDPETGEHVPQDPYDDPVEDLSEQD